MDTNELRKRVPDDVKESVEIIKDQAAPAPQPHPAGAVKHGVAMEILRIVLFTSWFMGVAVAVNTTQLLGVPLYWINRDYYYAYMALTKQSFGILITTITQWFSPTLIRVSWDESVRGQLRKTPNGGLKTNFPERIVLLANHQVYTDWLYLWWTAYTNRMHGHVFIMLKESLKYVPVISPGILFYGFIFMARKWASDKPRIAYRLQKLKSRHAGPMSGSAGLDPMWLLIFPEGTNMSSNTRKGSAKWAEKQQMPDMRHQLLPRSTGLQFCLQELGDSIEWVYDCTMAYEGVPYVICPVSILVTDKRVGKGNMPQTTSPSALLTSRAGHPSRSICIGGALQCPASRSLTLTHFRNGFLHVGEKRTSSSRLSTTQAGFPRILTNQVPKTGAISKRKSSCITGRRLARSLRYSRRWP